MFLVQDFVYFNESLGEIIFHIFKPKSNFVHMKRNRLVFIFLGNFINKNRVDLF